MDVRAQFSYIEKETLTSHDVTSMRYLKKSSSGELELVVPVAEAASKEEFIWIEKDFGPCVLALFKNYQTRKDSIWNQTFHAVSERLTFQEFTDTLAKCTSSFPTKQHPIIDCGYQRSDNL